MRTPLRLLLPTFALLLCCATGAVLSGLLLKHHAGLLWTDTPPATGVLSRLCAAVDEWGFDCAAAARRALDTLPVPALRRTDAGLDLHLAAVPTAFVGLAYFLALGIWFLVVGAPQRHRRAATVLPLLALVLGAAGSVVLLTGMVFGAAPACVACVCVHLVNLGLLGVCVARLLAPGARAVPVHTPVPRRGALAIILIVATVGGTWLYYADQVALRGQVRKLMAYRTFVRQLQDDPAFLLREFDAQPCRELPPLTDAPADGPRLVVFTDYACAACRCQWHALTHEVQPLFAPPLTLEIRHLPRPGREQAAAAAEAARQLGGPAAFDQVHAALLDLPGDLTPEALARITCQCGLDPRALKVAMDSDAIRARLAADAALAAALGVRATPALFLDGRPVGTLLQTPAFWRAYATRTAAAPGAAVAAARGAGAAPAEARP